MSTQLNLQQHEIELFEQQLKIQIKERSKANEIKMRAIAIM